MFKLITKRGTKVIFCCCLELVVLVLEYQECPCCLDSQSENSQSKKHFHLEFFTYIKVQWKFSIYFVHIKLSYKINS